MDEDLHAFMSDFIMEGNDFYTYTEYSATADCYAHLITKTDIYFTLATAAFL